MKERKPSYTVGGNVGWCRHYGEQCQHNYHPIKKTEKQKLKTELPYAPAIPLLGIYLEKNMIRKDTCTPMFTAAQIITAKTWKQSKYPSTEEWIKKEGKTYS